MELKVYIRTCRRCKKSFSTDKGKKIYCSKECLVATGSARRSEDYRTLKSREKKKKNTVPDISWLNYP